MRNSVRMLMRSLCGDRVLPFRGPSVPPLRGGEISAVPLVWGMLEDVFPIVASVCED